MHCTRKVAEQITWVGASDRRINRFENLFPLTEGVAYNSYLIVDDKTALLDTVDAAVTQQYLENVEATLAGRSLDYLVINHMEPDHCANIEAIVARYPEVKLVGNAKTFQFLEQFYTLRVQENYHVVKEGEEIELGHHTLKFFMAPLVHWPEVMMTYEVSKKILFSADAFGAFGALDGYLFADEIDYKGRTLNEARRYYVNIVGKYGNNVLSVLKKFAALEIDMICPLHGPVLRGEEKDLLMSRYQLWASYTPEEKSVLLVYGSMYGNTENAVMILANLLAEKGVKNLKVYDVSNTDPSYIISDFWVYSHIVNASPNYNAELYFKVDNLLREALALNFQNRKVSFISNSTWGGKALKTMQEYYAAGKNFEVVGEPVELKSSFKEENEAAIVALADAIIASLEA